MDSSAAHRMPFDIYQLDSVDAVNHETLQAYAESITGLFFDSPEGEALLQAGPNSGFWIIRLIECGYYQLGVPLPDMSAADIHELLREIFPRKIALCSPDEADEAVPELIAFWEYLDREYELPHTDRILAYLRGQSNGEFREWMNDSSKFGMAKAFFTIGQRVGFDMTDEREQQAFMHLYNSHVLMAHEEADAKFLKSRGGKKAARDARKRLRKIVKRSRQKNRK